MIIRYCNYNSLFQYITFKNVDKWTKEFNVVVGKNVPVALIGNKLDLSHLRTVPIEEAKNYAEKHGMSFFETSALDSTNVEVAFTTMLKGTVRYHQVSFQ